MSKRAVLYARVSDPNKQDTEDKVSLDQQLADMQALCQRNGWTVINEFVDKGYYKATQPPNRGKIVNPSGERADRPAFLEMLNAVKTGQPDIVLCWRDDRLVRHPRVAVALEDGLDIGDAQRTRKPKIEVRDATGAVIDRFTLSIKATIWREENKRRAERAKMGKIATLQQGRWPGTYWRYGYRSRKDGGRGRIIEVVEDEAQVVREIHEMYDSGVGVTDIRRHLINSRTPQKEQVRRKFDWTPPIVYGILRAEAYTGIATWSFSDGTSFSVEIPAIVDRELWERNQARLDRNKTLSTRNAQGIYLLQGLIFCGDCGKAISTHRTPRSRRKNGKRYVYKERRHTYTCPSPHNALAIPHPRPYVRSGPSLDWQVWRKIVDEGITQPDLIKDQILARQTELQSQGDDVNSEIAHARRRLSQVDDERAFYQRQAGRGRITETEFDARMDETEDARGYWQSELSRLMDLRDNTEKIQVGLDYVTELLAAIHGELSEIDIPQDELRELPIEKRSEILKRRKEIVQALCDKVIVYADGRVKIEGVLDGSEAAQFELGSPGTG